MKITFDDNSLLLETDELVHLNQNSFYLNSPELMMMYENKLINLTFKYDIWSDLVFAFLFISKVLIYDCI